MEYLPVAAKKGAMHIDGLPDAIKVVRLDSPKARRLAGLTLHQNDLRYAKEYLVLINEIPEKSPHLKEALWTSAIIAYFKCFGVSKARFQLDSGKIYQGLGSEAFLNFNYFRALRDKHVAHDENFYSQCLSGAAINDGKKNFKVEKIVCLTAIGQTLESRNYNNFKLLIEYAERWVEHEFGTISEQLTQELEKLDYAELSQMPILQYRVPTVDQVSKTRPR